MREFALVALLCVAGFFLGRYQTEERNAGRQDVFGRAASSIISPVAAVSSRAANSTRGFLYGVTHASELEAENRRLKSLVAAAQLYNQTLNQLESELDAMRRLSKLPVAAERTKIPAVITGFFQHESRITLNVGLKQGVRPGLPVLTADGLLATVQTSDANSCQALLISSPRQKLGAMVLRNPPSAGLLRGENATALYLDLFDPNAPVEIEDLVVTSGYSEHIPRGVPIGRVVQVQDDEAFGVRRAQIYPNALIGSVREVVVLK